MDIIEYFNQFTRLRKISSVEYAGSCPLCGGRDRFRVWTDTNFWTCRQCQDFKPRTLAIFADLIQKPLPEIKKTEIKCDDFDAAKWVSAVNAMILNCQERLLTDETKLKYLTDERFLKIPTIVKAKLGYTDGYEGDGEPLGMKNRQVKFGAGYVIPCFEKSTPKFVKIRQFEGTKYKCVSGSRLNVPFYAPTMAKIKPKFAAIVEGEFDALLLGQEVPSVLAISLGSVGAKYDKTWDYIKTFKKILVIPDNDKPGMEQAEYYKKVFPQSKLVEHLYKDVTEMYRNGTNLSNLVLENI